MVVECFGNTTEDGGRFCPLNVGFLKLCCRILDGCEKVHKGEASVEFKKEK